MMNIKKIVIPLFTILLTFFVSSCGSQETYTNDTYGYSFRIEDEKSVSGNDDALVVKLSDEVTAAIYAGDAVSYADAYYLTIDTPDELDLHSGAFEANYNNTLFVSQMLDYLFADSEQGIRPYAVRQSALNGISAWQADFTSEKDTVNGTIYVTVQNANSYIIVIYLFDSYDNRHLYDHIINRFIENFEF